MRYRKRHTIWRVFWTVLQPVIGPPVDRQPILSPCACAADILPACRSAERRLLVLDLLPADTGYTATLYRKCAHTHLTTSPNCSRSSGGRLNLKSSQDESTKMLRRNPAYENFTKKMRFWKNRSQNA